MDKQYVNIGFLNTNLQASMINQNPMVSISTVQTEHTAMAEFCKDFSSLNDICVDDSLRAVRTDIYCYYMCDIYDNKCTVLYNEPPSWFQVSRRVGSLRPCDELYLVILKMTAWVC